MKLIIIGGHLAPALAVIEALPKDTDILFLGRKHALEGDNALSLEYQTITTMKIPFETIKTGRLQRTFTRHSFSSIAKIPAGFAQANKIISQFKPDAVVGFGGYLQLPVCTAAYLHHIPIIIHEQTLKAGLANKIIAKLASKICISWQKSQAYFPKKKTILTGNPLRQEFFTSLRYHERKKQSHDSFLPTLYITGGSAGAHAINKLVEESLDKLLEKSTIIHQTGDARQFNDFARLEKKRESLPDHLQKRYTLKKFIEPTEVASTLNQADIVISRSGMNTICELLYAGKPCILIPLPYGQGNEQLENARLLERTGLGIVLQQKKLTVEIFYSQIIEILAKLKLYENNSQKAKKLIHKDAAQKIVQIILAQTESKNAP